MRHFLIVALACLATERIPCAQGIVANKLDARGMLSLAIEAEEIVTTQQQHDRQTGDRLEKQCSTMVAALESELTKRTRYLENLQRERLQSIARFKTNLEGKVLQESKLFGGMRDALAAVNGVMQDSHDGDVRINKKNRATFSQSSHELSKVQDEVVQLGEISPRLSATSSSALGKVAVSLEGLRRSFGDGLKKLPGLPELGSGKEQLRVEQAVTLSRYLKASDKHEQSLRASVAQIQAPLDQLQLSCRALDKAYGEREEASSVLATMLRDAAKVAEPVVSSYTAGEKFRRFVRGAVDNAAGGGTGAAGPMQVAPASTAELAGLEPRVVKQAVEMRARAFASVTKYAENLVAATRLVGTQKQHVGDVREVLGEASETL